MMLADAIELEVLAIEPEARLGIKTEVAETSHRLYLIDHLTANKQLGTYGIDVRVLTRPFSGFLYIGRFAIGIKPDVLYLHLLLRGVHIVYLHLTIMHEDTPVLDVDGMGLCEPHMAVDATT